MITSIYSPLQEKAMANTHGFCGGTVVNGKCSWLQMQKHTGHEPSCKASHDNVYNCFSLAQSQYSSLWYEMESRSSSYLISFPLLPLRMQVAKRTYLPEPTSFPVNKGSMTLIVTGGECTMVDRLSERGWGQVYGLQREKRSGLQTMLIEALALESALTVHYIIYVSVSAFPPLLKKQRYKMDTCGSI